MSDIETGWKGIWKVIGAPFFMLRRVPAAPWYALVGAVGESSDKLHYFRIGKGRENISFPIDGFLYIFANDYPSMSKYNNNKGKAEVTVTRIK
jgi:hypothetical protein